MAAPVQQPVGQWNPQPMNPQPMMGAPMNAGMQGQMAFRPMVPMAPMAGPFAAPGQQLNNVITTNQIKTISINQYWICL